METATKSYRILGEMAESGNPASISDVGVGLLASRACVEGAAMNVRINLGGLKDETVKADLRDKLQKISAESESEFQRIDRIVQSKLG
jgi:glutamate formiminotransferase/formiminotetrahydrofolate cyclodeaminase